MSFSTEHMNFMLSVTQKDKKILYNYSATLHMISLFYILKIGKSSHCKLTFEVSQFRVYQIRLIDRKFTGTYLQVNCNVGLKLAIVSPSGYALGMVLAQIFPCFFH